VITDGESEVNEVEQLQTIVDHLNQSDTSVNIIAIDFCKSLDEDSDEEYQAKKSEGEGEGDDDQDDKPNGGKLIESLIIKKEEDKMNTDKT
jgi:hypothetical protein